MQWHCATCDVVYSFAASVVTSNLRGELGCHNIIPPPHHLSIKSIRSIWYLMTPDFRTINIKDEICCYGATLPFKHQQISFCLSFHQLHPCPLSSLCYCCWPFLHPLHDIFSSSSNTSLSYDNIITLQIWYFINPIPSTAVPSPPLKGRIHLFCCLLKFWRRLYQVLRRLP